MKRHVSELSKIGYISDCVYQLCKILTFIHCSVSSVYSKVRKGENKAVAEIISNREGTCHVRLFSMKL